MPLRTAHKINLAVGSASAIVIAVAALGALGVRRVETDATWISHTHDVRAQLQAVSRKVDAAKADARGFLLTGESTYVRRSRANMDSARDALRRLQDLTVDDASQRARLAAVDALLGQRAAALDRTMELGVQAVPAPQSVSAWLAIGQRLSVEIDSTLAAADGDEFSLLESRLHSETISRRLADTMSVALVLSAMALAFILWRSIDRDLTGRARAEADLRASEAKFSGIMDIAVDAIITVDERQRIVHFNRGAETMFAYDRAEVLGQPLDILLPERQRSRHGDDVHEFGAAPEAARRMAERRPIFGRRRNGSQFPAEASISKLMTQSGWVFTAVVRDVTSRKRQEQAEHALATAGALLSNTLDYESTLAAVASLPVTSVGAWSVLVVADETESDDRALRRIASPHAEPPVNAALREWAAQSIDWDSPEAIIDVLRTGQSQRVDVTSDWLEAHLAGPREIEIASRMGMRSLLIVPVRSRDRTLAAWMIGSTADRSFDDADDALAKALAERASAAIENARLYRRAQRATSARDQVLSVVSHDLRNPLSAVSMLAQRLADDEITDDERRSIGTNILSSTEWMHRLMQDLLDVASIEAGRLSVEIDVQPVQPIVETVMALFGQQAESRDIQLRTELPKTLARVSADGSRVSQVLANLVGNALKFTRAGGVVVIGAERQGDEIVLRVRDSGVGISEKDLPHVFDRFWHARKDSDVRGNGLGLAIAQGIVRAHGGRIWVESVVGHGSTFFFTLPIARSSESLSRPRAAQLQAS